jgi:hypothetical protein
MAPPPMTYPDEELCRVVAIANERSEQHWSDGAEYLSGGEEDRDGLGSDFDRECLGHGGAGRTRAGRGEEEDNGPGDCLGCWVEHALVKQVATDDEHYAGGQVRAGDHWLAPNGVIEPAED